MSDEKPNYYGILPAFVRYARIPDGAKVFYTELTALTNKEGYCWATNEYFANLYNIQIRTIQRWIEALVEIGAITVEYGDKRKIYLANDKFVIPSHDKNVIYNNTRENTTREDADSLRSSGVSVAVAPSTLGKPPREKTVGFKTNAHTQTERSKKSKKDIVTAPKSILSDFKASSNGRTATPTDKAPQNRNGEVLEASGRGEVVTSQEILERFFAEVERQAYGLRPKGNELEELLWSSYPPVEWDYPRERRAQKNIIERYGWDTARRIVWGYRHLRDLDEWWSRIEPRFSAWSYKICDLILERIKK